MLTVVKIINLLKCGHVPFLMAWEQAKCILKVTNHSQSNLVIEL